MKPFDIFIAYISWGSEGKNRPVLVLVLGSESVFGYPITTKYQHKSKAIRARYYRIKDWAQAGLDRESYIDTGTMLSLPPSTIADKKSIGTLTIADKNELIAFIST